MSTFVSEWSSCIAPSFHSLSVRSISTSSTSNELLSTVAPRHHSADDLVSIRIDTSGIAFPPVSTNRLDLCKTLDIPLRDLRCLEDSFKVAQVVVIQRKAIILNLLYVRALIMGDQCMLVAKNADSVPDMVVEEVCRRVKNPWPRRNVDFEFLVLEGLLHFTREAFLREITPIMPQVRNLLNTLEEGEASEELLRALLRYSKQLSVFKYDIAELREVMDSLLKSDEDLSALYLSSYMKTGHPRRIDQHEEAELLFEAYNKRFQENENDISEVQSNVAATEEYIKIKFDGQRNRLMRLNLILSMGTLSVGMGAMGFGIFGMNLVSQFEEHPYAFYAVSGGVTGISGFVFLAMLKKWGTL